MKLQAVVFCLLAFAAVACSRETAAPTPTYHADENPGQLSDWGMMWASKGILRLSDNVRPYDLATPLFSDYASKLRTVWLPEGTSAQYNPDDVFDFPVGTVITKTFYYEQKGAAWAGAISDKKARTVTDNEMPLAGIRLMETRILVRRDHGWDALPYVWNDEQTDAILKRTGDIKPLTLVRSDGRREDFSYLIPNANQCAGCHATNATTKEIQPIGPKARHLNKPSTFAEGFNQLDHWLTTGLLEANFTLDEAAPRNAIWDDTTARLDARARAYLDANCSHCHNPKGPADTSGLNLEPNASGPALGTCKSPIAAGGGTGGRPFDILPGAPDESITLYRMITNDPGEMMPELGRAVTHEEGVALITEWIAAMEGGCS